MKKFFNLSTYMVFFTTKSTKAVNDLVRVTADSAMS